MNISLATCGLSALHDYWSAIYLTYLAYYAYIVIVIVIFNRATFVT